VSLVEHARVVNHHVYGPERLLDTLEGGLQLLRLGHVALPRVYGARAPYLRL
jgi:hypothetical protein